MKKAMYLTAAALALTACGEQQQQEASQTPAADTVATNEAAESYSGTGTVTAIEGDQVTISHGPIEAIGWPAMTMPFQAPPELASDIEVGTEVSFEFRDQGGAYVLTSIQEQ